ncbi:MAG TPA: ABC transporter permease subunit [Chloroflexota bacterium]|nr:ABC transporter permease subunit [Chloroflexota bacterium]
MALNPASMVPASPVGRRTSIASAPARRGGLPLLTATLAETRAGTAIACFYIAAVVLLVGALIPSLRSLDLSALISSSAGKALYGANISARSLRTFTGYLSIEFYSVWFGLFFGGYLAFISGGIVARPIEDGTIELMLARPFSRRRFYLERCGAMLLVGVIMSLWSLVAVWVTSRLFAGAVVDWPWLLLTQLAGGAFFVMTLGLGAVISAGSSVARGAGSAAIGVLILGYMLNSLASLSDRVSWLAYLSPFHYAPLSTILIQHQITWWHPVLLAGLGLAGLIAGLIIFERRDLT